MKEVVVQHVSTHGQHDLASVSSAYRPLSNYQLFGVLMKYRDFLRTRTDTKRNHKLPAAVVCEHFKKKIIDVKAVKMPLHLLERGHQPPLHVKDDLQKIKCSFAAKLQKKSNSGFNLHDLVGIFKKPQFVDVTSLSVSFSPPPN